MFVDTNLSLALWFAFLSGADYSTTLGKVFVSCSVVAMGVKLTSDAIREWRYRRSDSDGT